MASCDTLQSRFAASTHRHLGIGLDPQQAAKAFALLDPRVIETASNQEKMLVTGLTAYALADTGKKVFVATLSDYLAMGNLNRMIPIYDELGLTASAITSSSATQQRHQAYQSRITYGTIREFGFDLLRQRLAAGGRGAVDSQTALIIDEADRVLLDEAQSPLVIHEPVAATSPEQCIEADCFRWAAALARLMRPETDYSIEMRSGRVALTDAAIQRVTEFVIPASLDSLPLIGLLHRLERAIWVDRCLQRETHYRVERERIVLLGECTHSGAASKAFGGGMLAAIEAKEGLPQSAPTRPIARLTTEQYVSLLGHACGVTATAWEDRQGFRDVYALRMRRSDRCLPGPQVLLPPLISHSVSEKWEQITIEIARVLQGDRAVLLGTRNATESQRLSEALSLQMIEHEVLEDLRSDDDAERFAAAGEPRCVTILTNAGGRGADLRLTERLLASGGVHLILTQPHATPRLDRQLITRGGPPEVPRSIRRCYCLDDELLDQTWASEKAELLRSRMRRHGNARLITALFRRVQQRIQRQQSNRNTAVAQRDAKSAQSLRLLGLDPLLNPIFDPS